MFSSVFINTCRILAVAASGCLTMPPVSTIFTASSTLILRGKIFSDGTTARKPLVGLGVVGIKTVNNFLPELSGE